MIRRAFVVQFTIAVFIGGLTAGSRGQEVNPFGLSENDFSLWRIENAGYPFKGENGCYPIGNGIVFAHLGVDEDFNTLRGVTGPGYQIRGADGDPVYWQDGEWGALGIRILKNGREQVKWQTQTIKRLRRAPVVTVSQISDEIELHSLTYAPPNKPVIIREFTLIGGRLARAFKPMIQVTTPPTGDKREDGWFSLSGSAKFLRIYSTEELRQADEGNWWADAVNPRQGIKFSIVYQFSLKDKAEPPVNADAIPHLRRETVDWWREWNEGNVTFETPDPKFNDLMNELPMLIEVQRDGHSGAVSPMVSYHGFWIRDSNGPILALLANGKHNEVRQMLEYYRKAVWHYKFSHMLVPLDLELSDVPNDADFASVGVEHAEVPSWIILQHYWYFRYTGDKGFVRSAMPLLKRNLFGMPLDENFGAKFHGDETYTHGALYSTYDREESGKIGYPNGYIPTEFFSLDNTLLHREASLVLAEMTRAVGDEPATRETDALTERLDRMVQNYKLENGAYAPAVSTTTKEKWFLPFSNISLRKYWLWLSPIEEDGWKDYIWARDEILAQWKQGTTPLSGYSTGHNLAYWLVSAGILSAPEGESFLQRMAESATPEGAWCEVYSPAGRPVAIYGRINRVRPWESGINYDAILRYLSGLNYTANGEWTLSPKVIREWRSYAIRNLRAGNAIFDLEVKMDDEGFVNMNVTIHPEGGIPRWNPLKRLRSLEQLGVQLEKVPRVEPKTGDGKKLLVLTKDNSFKNVILMDSRLKKLKDSQIQAWDIGMPFTIEQLRSTLLKANKPRIPYLYLDRAIRKYDRRSFKDAKFWEGEGLKQLLADYEKAGGTVIDEHSLKIDPKGGSLTLNLLVVLYTNTFTWKMTEEDIENFHKEIAEWISWMDEVGKGKLQLKLDYLQIDRWLPPLQSGPQGAGIYWMSWKDVEEDLALRGIPRNYYDSFAVFWAWDRDAREDAQQAYGGAAEGPGEDVALLGEPSTMSYFGSAVLKSHPDRVSKVALHEYLHNVDAMFTVAGIPDAFISSDDMAKSMQKLLKERPGAFEALGYTDEDMLRLAEKELRKEAGFPWRTQMVFYRWLMERTPKEDFLRVFPSIGALKQGVERRRLYEKAFLRNEAIFYQVIFDPKEGKKLGLERESLTDKDDDADFLNLEKTVWFGGIYGENEHVSRYIEWEIIAPEKNVIYLDKPGRTIEMLLRGAGVKGEVIQEKVRVEAETRGKKFRFTHLGDGRFESETLDVDGGEHEIVLTAEVPGVVISPVKVTLLAKPSWDVKIASPLSFPMGRSNEAPIELASDAPSAEISVSARAEVFNNQLLSGLARNGFVSDHLRIGKDVPEKLERLDDGKYHFNLPELPPGKHTLEVIVERKSENGEFAYKHRFPLEITTEGVEFVIGCAGDPPGTARLIRANKRLLPIVPVIWEANGEPRFLPTDGERYLLPSGDKPPTQVYLYRSGNISVRIKSISALQKVPEWSDNGEKQRLLLTAHRLEKPPTLDSLEELSTPDIFLPGLAYEVQGKWEGEEDFSGKLGFGYDEDNLYIWGRIRDDQLRAGGTWDSDRINFVFDALNNTTTWDYPDGPTGYSGWRKDDYWVFANLLQEKPEITRMGGETATGGLGFWGQVKDASAQVERTNSGYRFVLALPFESLPYLKPKPGTAIGFGAFYSDWDDALTEVMFGAKLPASGGSVVWTYWDLGILYFAR